MSEILREVVVDSIRFGLPTVGAVVGARYGARRGDTTKNAVVGAGVGFLAGWATQKTILWLLESLSYPQMPSKSAVPLADMPDAPEVQRATYSEPSMATAQAAPTASAMAGMYAPSSRPVPRGEKGGGDGVSTVQIPTQTGQEPQVKVTGTLFKGAYGGMGN